MTEKEKPEINSAQKRSPVLLLLFVGFIFGFIVGYASKDTIAISLSKIVKTDMEATRKEPPKTDVSTTSAALIPENASETTPANGDETKEESKEAEGEKPVERP